MTQTKKRIGVLFLVFAMLLTSVRPVLATELSTLEKLQNLIPYADTLNEDDYTAESWVTFKEIRDQIVDPTQLPEQYQQAVLDMLQAAVDALVLVEDDITKYSITITASVHGTVTVDKVTAAAGDIVTVVVTPNSGYEVSHLTVADRNGNSVAITDNKFTMPAADVTVAAEFSVKPGAELDDGTYML